MATVGRSIWRGFLIGCLALASWQTSTTTSSAKTRRPNVTKCVSDLAQIDSYPYYIHNNLCFQAPPGQTYVRNSNGRSINIIADRSPNIAVIFYSPVKLNPRQHFSVDAANIVQAFVPGPAAILYGWVTLKARSNGGIGDSAGYPSFVVYGATELHIVGNADVLSDSTGSEPPSQCEELRKSR